MRFYDEIEYFCDLLLGIVTQERTRLVVFGVAKIQKTRLLATLSGLKVIFTLLSQNLCLIVIFFIVGSRNISTS